MAPWVEWSVADRRHNEYSLAEHQHGAVQRGLRWLGVWAEQSIEHPGLWVVG